MKILFFDDEKIRFDVFKTRFPNDEIVYCQTINHCGQLLANHANGTEFFDIIHFDHDIQDLETQAWYSSTALAEWFVNNCPKDRKPKMAVIHSVNQNGSWALYHIFSRLTKSFMSPFRLNENEYKIVTAIEEKNDKIQNTSQEVPEQR